MKFGKVSSSITMRNTTMVQRNPDFLKYFSSVNKLESRAHLSLSFHQIFTNNLLSAWANANGATFLLINSQSGKKMPQHQWFEWRVSGTNWGPKLRRHDHISGLTWWYFWPSFVIWSSVLVWTDLWTLFILQPWALSQKKRMWPTYDIIRILHCLKGTCCHILSVGGQY